MREEQVAGRLESQTIEGALISFLNSSLLAAFSTFVQLGRSQIVCSNESTKPCPPTRPDDHAFL